jgi:hypothetical protein
MDIRVNLPTERRALPTDHHSSDGTNSANRVGGAALTDPLGEIAANQPIAGW